LILKKISKLGATRRQILRLKCTKINFGWGSAPDPAGGAYSAPPNPLAVFKGPTSKGKEGKGKKGGKGKGKGREGRGERPYTPLHTPSQIPGYATAAVSTISPSSPSPSYSHSRPPFPLSPFSLPSLSLQVGLLLLLLSDSERILMIRVQPFLIQYTRGTGTDGQTDGQTELAWHRYMYTRYSIYMYALTRNENY